MSAPKQFSILRAAFMLMAAFVLLSFTIPAPAEGGGTGWCTDYDGNNFPCYDDSTSDYGYSGGGGGCVSPNSGYYDDSSSYSSGPSYVGEPHSEHPNVVWDGEYWTAADGYEWVSDDPDDYTVQPLYGTFHP